MKHFLSYLDVLIQNSIESMLKIFKNIFVLNRKNKHNKSVPGGKKYSFLGKFGMLCFLETAV